MNIYEIVFEKNKTCKDLDQELNEIYNKKQKIIIKFNLSKMKTTNLFSLLKYKPILEKYRYLTRVYLISSIICVPNYFVKNIIVTFLKILKPEKPTKLVVK